MSVWRPLSVASQVALHLQAELGRGRWIGRMPGVIRLASELGVSRDTIEAALKELERDGVLRGVGSGRARMIDLDAVGSLASGLRVTILPGDQLDRNLGYIVELMHELREAGHTATFASRSLVDLDLDVKKVARLVDRTAADAWVVIAGSRDVLEWFGERGKPTFALFGRRRGLALAGAGPDKVPAIRQATRRLIGLGHRRIMMLARRRRRLPDPGAVERAFLEELADHGIETGGYHLPDWEETIVGFHTRLDRLFRISPPTALIIQESAFLLAAMQFLMSRGLRVPRHVSLICTDDSPDFFWSRPSISHIRWDNRPVVRRVVRWVGNIGRGEADTRQVFTRAEFVDGDTIGIVRAANQETGEKRVPLL